MPPLSPPLLAPNRFWGHTLHLPRFRPIHPPRPIVARAAPGRHPRGAVALKATRPCPTAPPPMIEAPHRSKYYAPPTPLFPKKKTPLAPRWGPLPRDAAPAHQRGPAHPTLPLPPRRPPLAKTDGLGKDGERASRHSRPGAPGALPSFPPTPPRSASHGGSGPPPEKGGPAGGPGRGSAPPWGDGCQKAGGGGGGAEDGGGAGGPPRGRTSERRERN